MNVLFVDNIDSFTYNVVHLLAEQGASSEVLRNDDARLTPSLLEEFDALVVGPGPGAPADYPVVLDVVRAALAREMRVFGVCMGLQMIAHALGAHVIHAPRLMHGKVSEILHDGSGLFAGVRVPLHATRYHSLCVDETTLPAGLRVTARSDDGVVQAVEHRTLPVSAVQFHPESVLSEDGDRLVRNALGL